MAIDHLKRALKLGGAVAALALASISGVASAEAVGTVAAANQDITGTPPELQSRQKLLGDDVVFRERIETSPLGAGQILFLDQTSLSIAPNSDIVLNEYFYDPDQGVGDIVITMTKGALRFIGGLIAKDKPATIVTPKATIGIRGTGAIVEVDEFGDATVTVLSAYYVDIATPISTIRMTRPGSVGVASSDGAQFVGFTSAERLSGVFSAFEGNGQGGSTTVSTLPSEAVNSAGAGVASINSEATDAATAAPVHNGGVGDVASNEATGSAVEGDADFTTAALDDSSLGEDIEDSDLIDPVDVPIGDLAGLTGTGVYSGVAVGILTEFGSADIAQQTVEGTFAMTYDFDSDTAAIDIDIADTFVTVDVAADAANSADFSGSDAIFGGPDTITASGSLLSSTDLGTAGETVGQFLIDQTSTLNRTIEGGFDGALTTPQ